MGVGSFLLVLGIFFAIFSGSIISEFYYYNYNAAYENAIAYSQIVGLSLAAVGAGFLAYGHGMNAKGPSHTQPEA